MKIPRTLVVSPQGRKERGRLFDTLDNPFIMRSAIDYRSSARHNVLDLNKSSAGAVQEESQRPVPLAVVCID